MNPLSRVRKVASWHVLFWWACAASGVMTWSWIMGVVGVVYLALSENDWHAVDVIGPLIAMALVTASSFVAIGVYLRLAGGLPLRERRLAPQAALATVGVINLAGFALTIQSLVSGAERVAASVGNTFAHGFGIVAVVAGLRAVRGIRSAV